MSCLKNKKILFCITGSIAAYKACEIIRILRKEGAHVQAMLSDSAQQFVGKATFAALTNREVITSLFPNSPKVGLEHINHAEDLDALIVCPATANILCKAATGVSDDVISTTLSVCEHPTLYVPAMNFRMWRNQGTVDAVNKLRDSGAIVLDPESGKLASLHEGIGRLPEISKIMISIRELFEIKQTLAGKHVIVTAGPTREPIDPVRYISNHSSGKMGYEIAKAARDRGAVVTLISGPVSLGDVPEVKIIRIESAVQMLDVLINEIKSNNIDYLFMAAAVADFMPLYKSGIKLKRNSKTSSISLKPAPDILKSISKLNVGKIIAFALETEYNEKEAIRKMKDKNADFIALNISDGVHTGFNTDTNEFFIFSKKGFNTKIDLDQKSRLSGKLIDFILSTENSKV